MTNQTCNSRPIRKRRKGQGMVEFALVAPILLLVIFAIIDLGWIAFSFSQLNNAMREAVRYGSVPGYVLPWQIVRCDEIRSRLIGVAGFTGIKASDITIYYDDGRPLELAGNTAKVGDCPAGGNFDDNAGYLNIDGSARSPLTVRNDDRIIIKIENFRLRFLTPFLRTFAPDGIRVDLIVARSVFPDGEAVLGS